MNTDALFIKGKSHDICQDYAIAGSNYILISDGCSSSKDTDIGARILLKTAEKHINSDIKTDLLKDIAKNAYKYTKTINLNEESLDATFIGAIMLDNKIYIYLAGDGGLAVCYENNEVLVNMINYKSGYPFYLNYFNNESRLKSFMQNNNMININAFLYKDNDYEQIKLNDYFIHYSNYYCKILNPDNIKYIAIFTDGIDSFYRLINTGTSKNTEKVELKYLLKSLLGFKTTVGDFVKRRLNKFYKENDNNIFNHDDFTMAVMYL